MGWHIKIIAMVLGLVFFTFVFSRIRRIVIRPFYIAFWFGLSVFILSIGIFENLYRWISLNIFGFTDARHAVYAILIGILFVYAFYVTLAINKLQDHVRILVSDLAILKMKHQSERTKHTQNHL